jgi:hypothetical protein
MGYDAFVLRAVGASLGDAMTSSGTFTTDGTEIHTSRTLYQHHEKKMHCETCYVDCLAVDKLMIMIILTANQDRLDQEHESSSYTVIDIRAGRKTSSVVRFVERKNTTCCSVRALPVSYTSSLFFSILSLSTVFTPSLASHPCCIHLSHLSYIHATASLHGTHLNEPHRQTLPRRSTQVHGHLVFRLTDL